MRTLLHNNIWDTFDTFSNAFNDFTYRSSVEGHYNETEDGYEYELELPGYKKKDVAISAVDGVISIKASKDKRERKMQLLVPEDSDLSKIKGELVDGLLTLEVEKLEKAKPITVKLK